MIFFSRQKSKTLTPISNKLTIGNQQSAINNKEYLDPSGFKFSYPENLKLEVKDITSSKTLYADIEITSDDKKGKIRIKVEDTTKTFFDEFVKDKTTIETKVDDIEAYQFQEKKQLVTAAYDQGVQFTITADQSQEKSYWFGLNKQILNSFKFVQPEQPASQQGGPASPAGGTTTEDDVIFEGEEVIE